MIRAFGSVSLEQLITTFKGTHVSEKYHADNEHDDRSEDPDYPQHDAGDDSGNKPPSFGP